MLQIESAYSGISRPRIQVLPAWPPTGMVVRKVNTLTANLFILKIVNTDSLSEKHSNLFSSSIMRLGEEERI